MACKQCGCSCNGQCGDVVRLLQHKIESLQRALDTADERHLAETGALRRAFAEADEKQRRLAYELAEARYEHVAARRRHFGSEKPAERARSRATLEHVAVQTDRETAHVHGGLPIAARVYTFRSLASGARIERADVLVADSQGHRWAGDDVSAMRLPLEAMASGVATMEVSVAGHDQKLERFVVPDVDAAGRLLHEPVGEECVYVAETRAAPPVAPRAAPRREVKREVGD